MILSLNFITNQDYGKSTRLLAAATLRNILGTKTLSDILSEREGISIAVRRLLDRATKNWGILSS